MLKTFIHQHMDVIPYAFFGICTTLVNLVAYWLCAHPLGLPVVLSSVIAWIAAVLFAYLTNRKWVFASKAHTKKDVLMECVSFYMCRLVTGIIDWGSMFLFVDLLHFDDLIIKILANILVIVLNYVASKLIIFKERNADDVK